VYLYGEHSIVSTESSAVSTDDQCVLDVVTSNIEIVAAVVVAAVVVAGSSSGGGNGDDASIVIVLSLVMLSFFDKPVSLMEKFSLSLSSWPLPPPLLLPATTTAATTTAATISIFEVTTR
jgi:mevalonate kinase